MIDKSSSDTQLYLCRWHPFVFLTLSFISTRVDTRQ